MDAPAHRDRVAADAWLFIDGPVHVRGRPQIVLGVRGVTGMDVTFVGPNRALHSGHYGNWAPNPAVALAHFIAGIRDRDSEIQPPPDAAAQVSGERMH